MKKNNSDKAPPVLEEIIYFEQAMVERREGPGFSCHIPINVYFHKSGKVSVSRRHVGEITSLDIETKSLVRCAEEKIRESMKQVCQLQKEIAIQERRMSFWERVVKNHPTSPQKPLNLR